MAPLLSGYMIQYFDYGFLNAIKMKNAGTFGGSFYEVLLYICIFFYKRLHTLQNSNRKLLLEGLDACRHRKDCFQKHLCRCSE